MNAIAKGYGVDHVKVVEGLGCKAIRVTDPEQILPALKQAQRWKDEYRVPIVVEIILERVTNIAMGTDLGGAVKGFKKAMHEEEKDGDKPSDQPQAKVAHEENGNTYDVQAEQKPAADVHSGDRNEERK